jgi:hypothetical protein
MVNSRFLFWNEEKFRFRLRILLLFTLGIYIANFRTGVGGGEVTCDKFADIFGIPVSLTKTPWHRDFVEALKCNFCQNHGATS